MPPGNIFRVTGLEPRVEVASLPLDPLQPKLVLGEVGDTLPYHRTALRINIQAVKTAIVVE